MANDALVDFVEIYPDARGEFRWRAKSANGEIVAESGEGYVSLGYTREVVSELFAPVRIVELEAGE